MSLTERLNTNAAPVSGTAALARWHASLPNDEATAATNALLDPAWTGVDLRDVFIAEGAPNVAETTFRKWRRQIVKDHT